MKQELFRSRSCFPGFNTLPSEEASRPAGWRLAKILPRRLWGVVIVLFSVFSIIAVRMVSNRCCCGAIQPTAASMTMLGVEALGNALTLLNPDPANPPRITLDVLYTLKTSPQNLEARLELVDAPLFLAAPWLLPSRYQQLNYANTHDLLVLAKLRAQPEGAQPKALTVAFFSRKMVRMLQNSIYSLVKFGGVENYLVATWTEEDLQACMDLNLPCADASAFLPAAPAPAPEVKQAGSTTTAAAATPAAKEDLSQSMVFESTDYNRVMWLKPAVVNVLVKNGFAVHSTDIDLAYTAKPVWASYLALLRESGADAAFQVESNDKAKSPVNSGNYVILPSPEGKAFMKAWVDLTDWGVTRGGNQNGLAKLHRNGNFSLCNSVDSCWSSAVARAREWPADTNAPAILRSYTPPWWKDSSDYCALSGTIPVPQMDPCQPELLYMHPVCTPSGDRMKFKTQVLQKAGFWFIDDDCGCPHMDSSCALGAGIDRCIPLELKQPGFETKFEKCSASLAFSGAQLQW